MEQKQLISVQEICLHHNLDISFIDTVEEYQLIHFVVKGTMRHVKTKELPRIEQIIRLHYELEINMEGIEVIKHMLDRMETMQHKIQKLQSKLSIYE